METYPAHILVVDDEILNLEIISEYLGEQNYKISTAEDGMIAWDMLKARPDDYDIILLDRMMPNLNGMDLLHKIKKHPVLLHCPVIFQTAKASASDISEGLNAGAYYYLTKPFDEEVLLSVTRTAVNDRFRFKEIQHSLEQTKLTMGMLNYAQFEFKSLEEASSIASLVSNACPEPATIVMGLTELLINAVEHGNLGITYDEKSELNMSGKWKEEVQHRLSKQKYANKTASLSFQRNSDHIEITVKDQGNGFDWETYMDFDPKRVMDNHGRGIAVANKLCFSTIQYKGSGNEVCALLRFDQFQ